MFYMSFCQKKNSVGFIAFGSKTFGSVRDEYYLWEEKICEKKYYYEKDFCVGVCL